MIKPILSIILVNWNTRDLLLQCVHSIVRDCEGIETEIIVSDNASEDGSVDAVQREFPMVIVLRNRENLGFARGNNVAIKKCTGDYICLVNTDVEAITGCFRGLLNFMQNNPDIGLSAPQALYGNGKLQITARKEVGFVNTLARTLWIDSLVPSLSWYSHEKIEDVDVLAGCFWMIRREALEQVGLLDEKFFFYGEDRDYCKRMRLAGWRVVYNPNHKIYHYEGGSSKVRPFHYYLLLERAYLQYWQKYHKGFSQRLYFALRILYHGLRIITNAGAFLISFGKKQENKNKALRSWYCINMLLKPE